MTYTYEQYLNPDGLMEDITYEDIQINQELIELNLVPVESFEPQMIKKERASPYDHPMENKRPGKPGRAPERPDSELSPLELERLNRRRDRNRKAAAKCRQRRMDKISELELKVSGLTGDKQELQARNDFLQKELEKVKFQLSLQNQDKIEDFPAIRQLENIKFENPKSAMMQIFTPNGSLCLTPSMSAMFTFPPQMKHSQHEECNNTLTML
jgi:hypothetical protein